MRLGIDPLQHGSVHVVGADDNVGDGQEFGIARKGILTGRNLLVVTAEEAGRAVLDDRVRPGSAGGHRQVLQEGEIAVAAKKNDQLARADPGALGDDLLGDPSRHSRVEEGAGRWL